MYPDADPKIEHKCEGDGEENCREANREMANETERCCRPAQSEMWHRWWRV